MDAADSLPVTPIRKPLLPDSTKMPLHLLWISALPQLVLLLVNFRAFWVVSDECAPWQKGMFYRIFAFEITLILGAVALALALHLRRKLIPWKLNGVLLVVPILYLWLVTWQMGGRLIPGSVSWWILPREQLIYYQFALMMPVIFYATVRLACIELQIRVKYEIGAVVAAIFVPPVFWLLFSQVARFIKFGFNEIVATLVAITFLCSSVIVVAGVTRACVGGYFAIRRKGALSLGILSFFVAIAAPIGGLWLNSRIPFPADFQCWPVYIMALVNGTLLILPDFKNPLLRRSVWLSQCLLFPFTLYFLFVFLPFLPLFIPAMLAIGTGFLILTPTLLFFIHGQRILNGFRVEAETGKRFIPLLFAIIAIAVLPSITIAQAMIDRVVLRHAMDYVFSSDYRQPDRFGGSRFAVQRSLERLRDFKAGAYLPFLSDFYNWAVFDNLVLPDDKMNQMSRAFLGHDLEAAKSDHVSIFGGRPERSRPAREITRTAERAPSDISLANLVAKSMTEGDCERTTLTLELQNNSDLQGEYVTNLRIPDGVFVSGFWLTIGKERVPGKLFEKKTALWVYQQIRNERENRDPGILVYSAPNSIDLRIFPFAPREKRTVEIEFFYPSALQPSISIGDRQWRKESAATGICLALTSGGASAATLPPETAAQLPQTGRVPYLHFIIDRSAASKLTDEAIAKAIQNSATHFNGAKQCIVTFANYESIDLSENPKPVESINAASLHTEKALPSRGGFLAERAMKRALLSYHDRLARAKEEDPELTRYPVVIVISDPLLEWAFGNELADFGKFAPDTGGFYATKNGEQLTSYDFSGHRNAGEIQTPHPVALLKAGQSVAPCLLDAGSTQTIQFEAGPDENKLSVLDQGTFHPLNPTSILPAESPYSRGVRALQRYLAWETNPSLGNDGLAGVVALSRETGILLAATSYIVVENSAQWKTLILKENQKLGNQAALEFEETPEPSTWMLFVIGAATFYFLKRRTVRSV